MEQGSSSSPQTGGQVPGCPQSLPVSGSQDFCCPHTPGCGPGPAPPRQLLLLWMLLGLFALACSPPPLITVFGRFLLFIQTLGYLLQIGECLVWGCGWNWEGRKRVRSMFFGLSEVRLSILSPCLWNLPGSPARPAGSALSSVLELSVRKTPRPCTRQTLLPTSLVHFPRTCWLVQFQL